MDGSAQQQLQSEGRFLWSPGSWPQNPMADFGAIVEVGVGTGGARSAGVGVLAEGRLQDAGGEETAGGEMGASIQNPPQPTQSLFTGVPAEILARTTRSLKFADAKRECLLLLQQRNKAPCNSRYHTQTVQRPAKVSM